MCGICGVRRFSDTPIPRDMVDMLILHNQNRGLEASGIAVQQADGSVQVHKSDLTPFQFISSPEYKNFMDENLRDDTAIVLGHTRKVTKGSPKVNNNNHPMFAGKTAVVHNGMIHNDDTMFKDLKLERKAETDSDIFRAIFDRDGLTRKAVNALNRLSGNGAFAAISPDYPGKLMLGRSGNPLQTMATADYFMFSSETGPLYKAIRPYKTVYGIVMREMTPINYYMIGMNDHSAWLFGDHSKTGEKDWAGDWVEWHQEMRIAQNYTPPNYACHLQFRGNRMKFYDDRPVDIVKCPNPKCGVWLHVAKAQLKDLETRECGVCGTKLR